MIIPLDLFDVFPDDEPECLHDSEHMKINGGSPWWICDSTNGAGCGKFIRYARSYFDGPKATWAWK